MKIEDPISLLNTNTDVASGQHMPAGETMWSSPSVAMVDDDMVPGNPNRNMLMELREAIVQVAQKIYDEWDQNEENEDEVYGSGGICDEINYGIQSVLSQLEDIDIEDGGWEGDDHANTIVTFPSTGEVYLVDIPSSVYEKGGGYNWEKIPNVVFTPEDIVIYQIEGPLKKEALGLTDIPASIDGGEVLNFSGIPEQPGLSREMGDDEETDFFGAAATNPDEMPPANVNKVNDRKNRLNSIINSIDNVNCENFRGNVMTDKMARMKRIQLLNKESGISGVRKAKIQEINKAAGMSGAAVGSAVGLLGGLLPGLSSVPFPIRVLMGGTAGHLIQNYFSQNNAANSTLSSQASVVGDLQLKLKQYGVNDSELNKLAIGYLKPEDLPETMLKRGAKLPESWKSPLVKLAQQYSPAAQKLVNTFEEAKQAVEPDGNVTPQYPDKSSFKQPEQRKPQGYAAKGSITRPGDPYTYDRNPNGEGYVVVSAPAGNESIVGRVIKPGSPGYDAVKAADPGEQPKAQSRDAYNQALQLVGQAKAAQNQGHFKEAAELFKKAYGLYPTSDTLFNMAKAYYDAGEGDVAADYFDQYKAQFPAEWEKNLALIPDAIKNKMNFSDIPVENTPAAPTLSISKENLQATISKFLQGVPIRLQTPEGTVTTMDSKKVRRLTERYVQDISGSKDLTQGLDLVITGLMEEFGSSIEQGLQDAVQKGYSEEQLKGVFNGLIWQALRRGWAKWKGKSPSERQQARRLQRIENQDERMMNRGERALRREKARRAARHNAIQELHKIAYQK